MADTRKPKTGFPADNGKLSKEDCSRILHRALARSPRFSTTRDVARACGINTNTVRKYFSGINRPPPEKWARLRKALSEGQQPGADKTGTDVVRMSAGGRTGRVGARELTGVDAERASRSARRIRAMLWLVKEELEFFRDGPESARRILRRHLPGREAGRLAGLLTALYDEEQLAAFKTFVE